MMYVAIYILKKTKTLYTIIISQHTYSLFIPDHIWKDGGVNFVNKEVKNLGQSLCSDYKPFSHTYLCYEIFHHLA